MNSPIQLSSPPQQPPLSTTPTTLETTPLNQPPSKPDTVTTTTTTTTTKKTYIKLLVLNYTSLFIGSLTSSLLAKFYFIHKGTSRWVSTWIQSVGFPILLLPIFLPYSLKFTLRKPFTNLTKKLFLLSFVIGLFLGLNNLLFSWGTSYLPVSTSSLLLSAQLVFTLLFSWLIVEQKITFLNLNCVILLTLSSVLLGLSSSKDRPEGVTKGMYFVGYSCTIGAGLLFALYLPIMEKIYREVNCYEMVMEMQLIMEAAATILATIGMAIDGGFQEMRQEAEHQFDLGSRIYALTLTANIISWQLCFMGTAGMVFLTTSVTGGVCMGALLGLNVLGGVVVYGDQFGGVKVVSTLLCAWGFCSYVHGMYVQSKGTIVEGCDDEMELTRIVTSDE